MNFWTGLRVLTCILMLFARVAIADGSKGPAVGVTADPCRGVPVQPSPVHKAAADPYKAWMHDWLAVDWGQRCRYAADNAALPAPTRHRVVFLGDSITEGWPEADPAFFTNDVLGRGIGGQTTEQMLVRFRADVLELRPAVVHIMAATNDVAGNRGPTTLSLIEGDIRSLVEQAQAHHIAVVLASVPPADHFSWAPTLQPAATIRELNAWLRQYAHERHVIYADYYAVLNDGQGGLRKEYTEDGVHPNAQGYAAMTPVARSALHAALAAVR